MNNEQLDKIARDEAEKEYPKSEGNPYYSTARDIFVNAFRHGYNYPKWVSVKDALPKELEALNGIEMPFECRFSCHLEGGLFISDESGDVVNITHWEYASLPPTK
jgi:hypothetical protein